MGEGQVWDKQRWWSRFRQILESEVFIGLEEGGLAHRNILIAVSINCLHVLCTMSCLRYLYI